MNHLIYTEFILNYLFLFCKDPSDLSEISRCGTAGAVTSVKPKFL